MSLQIPLGATTVQTGLQVLINSPLSLGTYLALGECGMAHRSVPGRGSGRQKQDFS